MRDNLRGIGRAVGFALAMVALAAGVVWILSQFEADDTELQRQATEIAALEAGLDEANDRLEAQGEPPVPLPEVSSGTETPVVPVAPTQEQILSAFDVWCELRSCHGSDGSDGEDGEDAPPMTRQQIFAGFTEWCSTDPRCVGQPGSDGADSTTPGPPGRPPTAEEILAAVEVVCANDACDGDDGTNGTDGRDGSDGKDGAPGTAKPGTYTCPDGEYVVGFTVAEDGAVDLSCDASTPPVVGPPTPGPTPTP